MLWLVIAMVLMAVFNSFAPREASRGDEIPYSSFIDEYETGSVSEVLIKGRTVYGKYADGGNFKTTRPPEDTTSNLPAKKLTSRACCSASS